MPGGKHGAAHVAQAAHTMENKSRQRQQGAAANAEVLKSDLRALLQLGPQNPVDRAKPGAAATSLNVPGSRPASALPATAEGQRPLTAVPAIKRPQSRAGTLSTPITGLFKTQAHTDVTGFSPANKSPRGTPGGLAATAPVPRASTPSHTAASSLITRAKRANPVTRHTVTAGSQGQQLYEHASIPRGVRPRLAGPQPQHSSRSAGSAASDAGLLAEQDQRHADREQEVQARVRQWYQLLQLFKKQPESIEFVYLRNADPDSVHFNPYNLEIVPHAGIKGCSNYYTISSKGVTHLWDNQADFCGLEQFEREYFLYTQLMRLRMFRKFRMWKAFRVWRRGVAARKVAHAREVLTAHLFMLQPVFSGALLRVRGACDELSRLRLHAIKPGQLYGLDELMENQRAQRDVAARVLADFWRTMVHVAQDTCFRAIDALEQELLASKEKSNQARKAAAAGMPTVRLAVTKAAQMAGDTDFSYAINAARRSEKRRVYSFVRLLDYMICNALHSVLVGSVSDMLSALTPSNPPVIQPLADEQAGAMSSSGKATSGPSQTQIQQTRQAGMDMDLDVVFTRPKAEWGGPFLQLEVLMEPDTDELLFSPPAEAFFQSLADIQVSFVEQVKVMGRLLVHEKLQELMEKPLDGGSDVDLEGFGHIIVGEEHKQLVEHLGRRMHAALDAAQQLRDSFLGYRDWVVENRDVTPESLREEVETGARDLEGFRTDFERFRHQLGTINRIRILQPLGVLQVHLEQLVSALRPSPDACLQHITQLLPQLASEVYHRFIAKIHSATSQLQQLPSCAEEFAEHLEFYASLDKNKPLYDKEYDLVVAHYDLLEEFDIRVPDMQLASYQTMDNDYVALRDAMWSADSGREAQIASFKAELDVLAEQLQREGVTDIRLLAQHDMILDEHSDQDQVLEFTQELVDKVQAQLAAAQRINKFQRLFRLEQTQFTELQDLSEDVGLRHALWASRKQWGELTAAWRSTPLESVQASEMDEACNRTNKQVYKMERGLVPNKVVQQLRDSVAVWRELVPVVQALRNPDLKERHWAKVNEALGVKLQRDDSLTLEALIELNVLSCKDALAVISTEATQEAQLEAMLEKVNEKWRHAEFTVNGYKEMKDAYILGGVDEVAAVLEDSIVVVATISTSRFVAGIRPEVEKAERQLRLFSDCLDEWLECQKQWLYLEPIFSASDIQRQLPTEARAFMQVDRQFKEIMRRTKDRPNAMQAATIPGLLEVWRRCNETLEQVQKNLEDYLETKRVSFPRFYFLSNDELLEILSQTRNVRAVQPHLQKCFDGIRLLDFGDDPKSIDILAMISGEGERVALAKNLKARGNVEAWLTAVESSMHASLRALTKKGVKEYAATQRGSWVLQNVAQLVIVISNIYWCQAVEGCLTSAQPTASLQALLSNCSTGLTELTALVRGQLTSLQRKVLVALITIDVHNRDIVEQLVVDKVSNTSEFGWQMQLRYEYDAEADQVYVCQVNARFQYGYEYLGAQPRLVVTPMTDRCYLTLTGALHMKLGGAPAGPAGTGKTETTKDLGKALGVQCVVFNCGENLDYKFMGKFFSGLAQCGAWACFDEFNRIDIEVLSVVAQQLLAIQNALKAGLERFLFEGREMRLVSTCGVFITMNPGYAGRTELPDNLKALFRPMSMMIPDYALVAEVMLFSEGFSDARSLSRKMVKLYKLASEQLSQQDHYDFGMRALKSVLVMAGALKRAHPELVEDIVLIRAMRDSNIPKFLSEDARLFNAIVSDLFPGVDIPQQDYGVLQVAAVAACEEAGLQPVPHFITKVIQLYETFNVRFGVMLVGPTGGGKTQCYRMLSDALTHLREQNHPEQNFQAVHTYVLNPKAIKMGELFGEYNLLTNEWSDGLASNMIRVAANDTRLDRQWVVFDGPVDAVWVENMNTVLDDNCMLCLPNGERIKLNPVTMRMLFEVADLAVASPATVSRCGMVYVPPEDLGWQPYVRSWLSRLAQLHTSRDADAIYTPMMPGADDFASVASASNSGPALVYSTATLEFIWQLFDQYVATLLQRMRQLCRTALPCCDISLVTSLVQIFTAMSHPSKGLSLTGELEDSTRIALRYVFAFSCVWGLGGSLESTSWDKWDKITREVFEGDANYPAGSHSVFEYYVDPNRNFQFGHWDELVPKFKFNPELPYFQLLVPTMDTARYAYLLQTCLEVRRPVLFTGGSGVGKSAVMQDTLTRLSGTHDIIPVILNFSAQTSSNSTQAMIEAKLEKKRKKRFGAPTGKHLVLFVDDVNMPQREVYGAQPPLELLRQLLDFSGFYDRKKLLWKEIEGVTLCAACGPPGGGRQEMSQRFTTKFTTLCMPPASEMAMRTIFTAILGGFFDTYFTAETRAYMLKPMVDSSVEVYLRIAHELLPTPTKSHYTFNLRDVSKVFQGLLSIRPAQCAEPRSSLTRLWVHETMRVFHDRLVCEEDKTYFKEMLYTMLKARFEVKEDYEELFVKRTIMFGDYMHMGAPREERVYEEVVDQKRLTNLLNAYLDEYNLQNKTPLQLVFFLDAIQHISRIARILRQPRGSAMLVGVGGSGKQSLTRFAAFISETQCFSIELTRSYGVVEFREDLKKLYRIAGVEGRRVAFLFSDSHILCEAFVEDINSMLNSGEITGLFAPDERERILADVRQWAADTGVPETRDAIWRAFIERVRDHLHLVLAMSPVGEAFRARCRQFPSLINCCTIDWYSEWPAEALLSVSQRFLENQELGGQAVNDAIASMCVDIHTSVSTMAEKYYHELRRRYYVTPKSYLDLIQVYISLLRAKRQEMALARDRLLNGLAKLNETNLVVDRMQRELAELQPVLAQKTVDTQQLLVQVQEERESAEAIRHTVAAEEEEVKKKQAETLVLKNDAQRDLEDVLPALEAAEKALQALNKNDIVEIKTFTKPPLLVQLTMEGVCTLLQEKPDWDTAKRVLGEPTFIKRLVEYDKDNIPEKVVRGLKRLIDDPTFTPDQVAKQSRAAMSMCLWVRAMDTYAKVTKVVEPKRDALRGAQMALDAMNAALAAKTAQLEDIQAKVEELQMALEGTQAELKSLQQQADLSSKRLARAAKLISALSDESVRWKMVLQQMGDIAALVYMNATLQATAEGLGDKMMLLVGDVFLSAACISYTGAFTGTYRAALTSGWVSRCRELDIPVSEAFSLQSTLATAVEVREWCLQGLPTDALSVDNGILVTRGSRWALMVDPQDQANRWIKAMEGKAGLRSLRVSDSNILRTLENCIRVGSPVLLEDVGESLDPALEPLLQKQTFTQGTRTLIRLGDSDVDYDANFRFYMTTKLPNPHYLPEVCIKVNLINFTVTMKGLEDQLLGDVVRKERPELEEARDRLVLSISNDKRQLAELEDKVLKLLRDSTGNILDDEVLINTLNNSKTTSALINARVREAEDTERAINTTREQYRPVPVRASILYFVVADLAGIDPMYQYSLAYFTQLFNTCIDKSARSEDLNERLRHLLSYTTQFMYAMVCRGLFEQHKLIFSFLIATSIQREAGGVPADQWKFLLRGSPPPKSPLPYPMALAGMVSEAAWLGAQCLEQSVTAFQGKITSSMQEQPEVWRAFSEAAEPDKPDILHALATAMKLQAPAASSAALEGEAAPASAAVLVPGSSCALNGFQALLLIKVLCEDKLMAAMQRYVAASLGTQFTESPPSTLAGIHADSSPVTPIIFILSQGADPTAELARFGESMGRPVGHRLHIISLGQGQGPIAESTLSIAVKSGDWVCLQNCHLAKSWMPRLAHVVEELAARYAKQQQWQAVAAETGLGTPNGLAREDSGGLAGGREGSPSPTGASSPSLKHQDSHSASEVPDVHPEFRLWLTSMPAPHFPVPVLQNGIKVTQEAPKGVRANLLRVYGQMAPGSLDLGVHHPHASTWRKLVWSLAMFHAVCLERRRFGPLGWNIPYEFSSGDLDSGMLTLKMFLDAAAARDGRSSPGGSGGGGAEEEEEAGGGVAGIPWEALTYVTGQINYGGRVTDDNDRRLLMCMLHQYYNTKVIADVRACSIPSAYQPPAATDIAQHLSHIRGLPLRDDPQVFGLRANAAITFNLQEARKMLDVVLAIQPRMTAGPGGAGTKSPEEALLEVVSSVEASLPTELLREKQSVVRSPFAALPSGHDNSLGTVLAQEMDRFNALRRVLSRTCAELTRAIKGLAVMSAELEGMATSLANNQVPALWARVAYPSLKPLASWVKDLMARMSFMEAWLTDGQPHAFWLPAFFFPQGFMTAVLQNHARNTRVPIDHLSFKFEMRPDLDDSAKLTSAPEEGVYVHGLYLESALWDTDHGCLAPPPPGQMYSSLPTVHLTPAKDYTPPAADYQCPLYKTSVRAGVLSTTGQSTIYVLSLSLPLPPGSQPSDWVLQGVAALCALDD